MNTALGLHGTRFELIIIYYHLAFLQKYKCPNIRPTNYRQIKSMHSDPHSEEEAFVMLMRSAAHGLLFLSTKELLPGNAGLTKARLSNRGWNNFSIRCCGLLCLFVRVETNCHRTNTTFVSYLFEGNWIFAQMVVNFDLSL